ncbi:MAG: cytidine/deoxycytidylate deaminase family protein [Candidatus Caldatribacterium sp.]|nr:cytidine/deoxycytidylate deaminase family protein [Candidatus Caldatribacterium sp.]
MPEEWPKSVPTKSEKARPGWDEYFIAIAHLVATRSTCIRRQVGAVLVKDKRILATGYNGAPTGIAHCTEDTCLRNVKNVPSGQMHELCRGLHAEQNVIIQAALYGVSTKGSTLYCTHKPCILCVKMLINAGIIRIVYENPYPDPLAEALLEEAGMEVTVFLEGQNGAS